MDFEKFTKVMLCKVQLFLGSEYEASLRKVKKNNGVTLSGVTIRKKGENICPTFYVDDLYNSDMSENDVEYSAMTMANQLKNTKMLPNMNLDFVEDFELAKENITLKVINADRNKELLLDVPHRRIHNLAIIYCYVVSNDENEGNASVTVTNRMMEGWNTDERTLFETAYAYVKSKMPFEIVPLKEVIRDMGHDRTPDLDIPIYLLSNKKRFWGAAAILDFELLEKTAELFDSDFFILPSSIHELIAIKGEGEFAQESSRLLEMVREVNANVVEEQEFLADSVYYYDRGQGQVLWIC